MCFIKLNTTLSAMLFVFVAYKIKIMKLKKKIQLSLIGCPVFLYLFPFLFKPDIAQSALFW